MLFGANGTVGAAKMATPTASIPARWPRLSLAETVASDRVSAACYRGPRNIDVLPIVIAELKFRDVQRQIFAADLVMGADNVTLKNAPEAFNRVGMDSTNYVFALRVLDDLVRRLLPNPPLQLSPTGRAAATPALSPKTYFARHHTMAYDSRGPPHHPIGCQPIDCSVMRSHVELDCPLIAVSSGL
jgi:hypothetical protein